MTTHIANVDAHGEPTITTDSGTATADDQAFSIVGGEGIDTSGSTTIVTIAGEDATDTNKGIAKFDVQHFTVTSGDVDLKVDTVPVSGETDEPIVSDWAYKFSTFGNRTHITGGVISDAFDETCDVTGGTAWAKVSHDLNAEGVFFSFSSGNTYTVGSHALTDNAINYIYLDYNGGSPQIVHDDDGGFLYTYDHIVLGCAYRHGTHCHIINSTWAGLDAAHMIKMRAYESFGAQRAAPGLMTTDSASQTIEVTAGILWVGLTRQQTLSFDTGSVLSRTTTGQTTDLLIDSGATFTTNDVDKTVRNTTAEPDTYTDVVEFIDSHTLRLKLDIMGNGENYSLYDAFDTWYTTNSGSTWEQTEHVTQVDNFYWNKITTGKDELDAASHYAVHWLFIDYEGHHLHMLYGQASGIQAVAEAAPLPSVMPPILSNFGVLIAKIIVLKNDTTLIIAYPWTTQFTSSSATAHDSLTGVAASTAHTNYMLNTVQDAYGILASDTDDSPGCVTLSASEMIGRKSTGGVVALAKADILTIINVTESADVTGDNAPKAHTASHTDGTDDIQTTSTSQKGIVQLDGTAGGTNSEVAKPPTSDAFYDHGVATTGVHGAGSDIITFDGKAMVFALALGG